MCPRGRSAAPSLPSGATTRPGRRNDPLPPLGAGGATRHNRAETGGRADVDAGQHHHRGCRRRGSFWPWRWGFFFYASGASDGGPSGGTYQLNASFRSAEGSRSAPRCGWRGCAWAPSPGWRSTRRPSGRKPPLPCATTFVLPDDSAIAIASEGLLGAPSSRSSPVARPSTTRRATWCATRKARSAS